MLQNERTIDWPIINNFQCLSRELVLVAPTASPQRQLEKPHRHFFVPKYRKLFFRIAE